MGAEVEIVLRRVTDLLIDACTGRNVVALAHHVLAILAEETHVMTLLDADEGNARVVGAVTLQLQAGIAHCLLKIGR